MLFPCEYHLSCLGIIMANMLKIERMQKLQVNMVTPQSFSVMEYSNTSGVFRTLLQTQRGSFNKSSLPLKANCNCKKVPLLCLIGIRLREQIFSQEFYKNWSHDSVLVLRNILVGNTFLKTSTHFLLFLTVNIIAVTVFQYDILIK